MLNFNEIYKAVVYNKPFCHVIVDNFFNIESVNSLLMQFPTESFVYSKRDFGTDKSYSVSNNILFPLETQLVASGLSDVWKILIKELTSDLHRKAISEVINYDITNAFVEITLKNYRLGDFITPHTDRHFVPVTHLLFLNRIWEKNWGAEFCIMESATKIAKEITPLWSNSIIFKQSNKSWHSVKPCLSQLHGRISLQVAFWTHQNKPKYAGRHEETIIY